MTKINFKVDGTRTGRLPSGPKLQHPHRHPMRNHPPINLDVDYEGIELRILAKFFELEDRIAQLESFLGFKQTQTQTKEEYQGYESARPAKKPVDDAPRCPDCGAAMRLRKPRPGGKQFDPFYGCSTYPRCRGTMSLESEEPFAEDEGDLDPDQTAFGPGPDGWDF